jgi:hypothetical protein
MHSVRVILGVVAVGAALSGCASWKADQAPFYIYNQGVLNEDVSAGYTPSPRRALGPRARPEPQRMEPTRVAAADIDRSDAPRPSPPKAAPPGQEGRAHEAGRAHEEGRARQEARGQARQGPLRPRARRQLHEGHL